MKFYEFPTSYAIVQRVANKLGMRIGNQLQTYEWLLRQLDMPLGGTEDEVSTHNQWLTEHDWIKAGRPYYSVYPGIVPYLCRLKEDKVLVDYLNLPVPQLSFKFSEQETFFNFDWRGQTYKLKAMLVSDYKDAINSVTRKIERSFTLWQDWGEKDELGEPVFSYYKLLLRPGRTIQQELEGLPAWPSAQLGVQVPYEKLLDALRCVLSCCLISQNKEDGLIEPIVLNADRDKFDKTNDPKYIDKAKRRGQYGWTVGEHLEVNPHYRGPSPLALYWTGKGGKIPLYRFRRGTIVHRKKVAELPTGYGDDEGLSQRD